MQEQIQCVFDAGLVDPLVKMLSNAEFDIKKEAAWAISNATSGGSAEQVRPLSMVKVVRMPELVHMLSIAPVWGSSLLGA